MSPEMEHSSHGREDCLIAVGPETEKEQSQNFVEDLGTKSKFLAEERSRLFATLMQRSEIIVWHEVIQCLICY